MRLKQEQPQNPIEQKIEDLLIATGHYQNEIQFRGGDWNEYQQRFETRYLRYDYWRNIDVADESEIWNYVSSTVSRFKFLLLYWWHSTNFRRKKVRVFDTFAVKRL